MANKYVFVDYNKFEDKKNIKLVRDIKFKNFSTGASCELKPRRTITSESDYLVLDVNYEGGSWMDLNSGSLIFHLDNGENIELEPHFSHREKWYSDTEKKMCYCEEGYYDINEEDFLKICNAKTAELRFNGSHYYQDFICNKSVMNYFRIFYNGAYNSKSYIDALAEYENKRDTLMVAYILLIIIGIFCLILSCVS